MDKTSIEGFRVSRQQGHIWRLLQTDGDMAYRAQAAVSIKGRLDGSALQTALSAVVQRHEILRTTFQRPPGRSVPVQVIGDSPVVLIERIDPTYSHAGQQKTDSIIDILFEELRQVEFDFEKGPLVHARVVQLSCEKHVLLLCVSALCGDGATLNNLIREIADHYCEVPPHRLSASEAMQYADFAQWQSEILESEESETGKRYWGTLDIGEILGDDLPFRHSPEEDQAFLPDYLSFALNDDISRKIEALARDTVARSSEVLLSVWIMLLWRLTGRSAIMVGADCDGRKYEELASAFGPFAMYLPLYCRIEGTMPFSEVLQQIHLATLENLQWQECFSWEELDTSTIADREPFCAVGFQYAGKPSDIPARSLLFSICRQYQCNEAFEVKLSCVDEGSGFTAELQFDPRVFKRHDITRLGRMFQTLLSAAIATPESLISDLEILTEAERQQLTVEFNDTCADYDIGPGIHHLIEQGARSWCDSIAVVFEHQRLSYACLESRSSQLVRYLNNLGIGPETRVGISVEPSLEMVVGILGILKSGAAYVPLDPAYPGDRLAFMIEDARVPVLLTQRRFLDKLLLSCQAPGIAPPEFICLDSDWDTIARGDESRPMDSIFGGNGAYLIYTSGSTGRPKGILVDHRNLVNSTMARLDYYDEPAACFLLLSSFSFDSSVVGIFSTLCQGGALLLRSERIRADVAELIMLIDRQRVTHTLALPSLYSALLEQSGQLNLTSFRAVIVAGADCPLRLVEHHHQRFPMTTLFNEYGPTEATVWSTVSECQLEPVNEKVSIGRPVANTRAHLLDPFFQSVPIGIPGELVIGGLNLSRGYLGRPDLTADKFVPDPFSDVEGSRLYRTGDMARYGQEGRIEFIGRFDNQVKIRGYRIELGEIEAVLNQHPHLTESAVIVREDAPGEKRLVAYIVAGPEPDLLIEEVRAFVRERLPVYMVPAVFVILPKFPLTPNGKVDRRALAATEQGEIERSLPLVKPRTPIEEVVAGSWSEVLGVDQIGVDDNFFELSGHSLNTTQVISRLSSAFNVDLPLRSLFESPTVAGLAMRVEEAIRERRGWRGEGVRRYERERTEVMSYSQERLWFLQELEPGSVAYNVPYLCRLKGRLNRGGLEQSIREVIRRHEVLRTTFRASEGKARQVIGDVKEEGIGVVDIGNVEEKGWEREAVRMGVGEGRREFDLERGPLMRVVLVRRTDEEHVLMLVMHHIISDGWSMGVLVREMGELYEAYTSGRPSGLGELEVQYADYARWQREWMNSEKVRGQEEYWRERLGEGVGIMEVPTDRARTAVQTYEGGEEKFLLTEEVSREIRGLSREEGSTVFMTLLAGFKAMLNRYSGQREIVVGTPIANRSHKEIEGLIGSFVNTLVLRTEVGGEREFREVLRGVRETTLEAYANQDIPFEQIVEWVQPERDLRRSPIFQVMFILQNAPLPRLELSGMTLSLMEVHNETAKFDLTLSMSEREEGLVGAIEYNSELYDRTTVERMAKHYKRMMEKIVEEPGQRITEIDMLGEEERHQLVVEWGGDTWSRQGKEESVHELIEKQVERTGDRIGVVEGENQLSYEEVNRRANQLGRYLKREGVGKEEVIGICVSRSVEMVVGMAGVLKAGGAYLPLDAGHPRQRIEDVLKDAGAGIVVTDEEGGEVIRGGEWKEVRIGRDWGEVGLERGENINEEEVRGDRLGYVIYTSGSTGKPKGVEVEHREIVNFLESMKREPGIDIEDIMVAVTTISFDIAGLELMLPLTVGGRVEIAGREEAMDGEELRRKVEERRATVMQATPATWRLMREGGWEGTEGLKILCGGEELSGELARELEKRGEEVWNLYGPTETTIWSTAERVKKEKGEVTIGGPIGNTQVRIVDEDGGMAGVGIWGEVVIGGEGVARGYRGLAEMTAERFVPDEYAEEGGRRAYRTGDIGRYRKDGRVEYQGRKDRQVKIRGYRIEVGEIEAALGEHEWVREAAVTVREDVAGDKRLVAYVVPEWDNGTGAGTGTLIFEGELAPKLRGSLKEKLPEYMVPAVYVMMDRMPLTGSGKVDRKALPAPGLMRQNPLEYTAAQTATEKALARIYEEVLELKQVGVTENFFRLGGHSLLAMQVMSRVRDTFKVSVPLKSLFESPTVAGLATRVEFELRNGRNALQPRIERVVREGNLPLAFAQQRLWFLDQLEPDTPAYNISTAVAITGSLNPSLVEQSVNAIIERHEVLRTRFPAIDAKPIQLVAAMPGGGIALVDLSALPEAERRLAAEHLAKIEDSRPFDLGAGPVLRTTLLRLDPTEHLALFVMHHIVSDLWSMGVVVREMTALCESLSAGKPSSLTELPVQYADYAVWQHRWLSSKWAEDDIAYWKQKLGRDLPVLELPTDHPRGAVPSYRGARVAFELPAALTQALAKLSQQEKCTLSMTLLASFKAMLQSYALQREIVVGTDVAGRHRSELEGLIGLFVNQLVLRTDLSGDPTFVELLGRVREVVLEAFAHQDLPFDRLVSELRQERDLSRNPLFQVLFVMQNVPGANLQVNRLTLKTMALDNKTSKFDLALFVEATTAGLVCSWNYSTDLFERETIIRMTSRFELLLNTIVGQPGARVSELGGMLAEAERKERIDELARRKVQGFERFKSLKPKSVRLPQGQLVRTGYLDRESSMPLVLQPVVNDVDLQGWVRANSSFVETELLKHGAILFRGFSIDSVAGFERIATTICPDLFGDYGDLPREEVSGKVYGATPYPCDQTILFHNESSHLHSWPMKIMFFCVQPPERGGETPFVDCRKIYALLDPALRERFAQKGLMYVRKYIDGLDVSWQSFFKTTDKGVVEERSRRGAFDLEWTNGGLKTRRVGPAVASHPKTGEMIFFNQLQLHHVSCLHPAVRQSLDSIYAEDEFPRQVFYGDGSRIEESVVESICRLYRENSVSFSWQRGDMLVLDNMLGAHGRNPYVGVRKIVVAIGEMFECGMVQGV